MADLIPVRSWGRLGAPLHRLLMPADIAAARQAIAQGPWLARGLGRSYGDVAHNSGGLLIDTTLLDRFVAFDHQTGLLISESGVSLEDIIRIALPNGWFLPTTPGTKFVTLGGAIANDVHGKNHHVAGTLGCWVRWLELARSDGALLRCSADENRELFAATIGGLGLTGLITRVAIQLVRVPSAWLINEDLAFRGLDEFLAIAEESDSTGWEHTVAWMDCVAPGAGRGVFSRARWTDEGDLDPRLDGNSLTMPVNAPGFMLNPVTVKLFNTAYFRAKALRAGQRRVHYNSVFYPLDGIRDWNKLYGTRGFYQYQCVIPTTAPSKAVQALLDIIAQSGQASFLVVIKTFGARTSPGLLSFPMPGINLALDFPNRGEVTEKLLTRLDGIVTESGGRIYPAKDARMPPSLFRAGYPAWEDFAAWKDPGIASDFWRRVATEGNSR